MAPSLPVTVNIRRQVIVDSRENHALCPEHVQQGSCAIHSSMTIFFDLSSNTAFFKLQSSVALPVQSSQTDHYDTVRSNVHLCIRPEHVTTLVHDRLQLPERLAPLYKKIAGQETLCLHFSLFKTAEWILPSFESLMPKTHDDARFLEELQRLTKVQSMAIYMLSDALSKATVSSLCEAASKRRQLHSTSHHADFQRWYSSPGGKAVPPDDIADVIAADRPTESPRSYDVSVAHRLIRTSPLRPGRGYGRAPAGMRNHFMQFNGQSWISGRSTTRPGAVIREEGVYSQGKNR